MKEHAGSHCAGMPSNGMADASPGSWRVYVLRCADSTLYTGITNNLEQRISRHNEGVGARYTRSRLPVELVYSEPAADRSTAQRREWQIKRLTTRAKRELIAG